MNMCYQPTADLMASALLTYTNMRGYYEHYGVDWQQLKICEQISDLENWDVLLNGDVVGAMRLAFDDEGCYIRDLQVDAAFQNMGIGAAAITPLAVTLDAAVILGKVAFAPFRNY